MDAFINAWGSDEYRMGIAALCSVVGFALSVWLLILTGKVNRKINKKLQQYSDIENFNKNREKYRTDLESYQMLISKDGKLNADIAYKVLNIITEFENHRSLIGIKDRLKIWRLKVHLNDFEKEKSKKKIASKLSYFISRFNKKEEQFL